MNPILARSDRLALYLGGWVITGGLLASAIAGPSNLAWGPALVDPRPPLRRLRVRLPLRLVRVPGDPAQDQRRARHPRQHRRRGHRRQRLLAAGRARRRAPGRPVPRPRSGHGSVCARIACCCSPSGSCCTCCPRPCTTPSLSVEESRAAETRALELQLLAREAELKTLRAQIDPHFLFNCLHSISALTGTDPPAARRMCLLLGEFLRTSVKLGAQDRIPFADELALAERYLEIERVRFGSRLAIERAIADGVGSCAVPALLLQPLVENAVTHGIAHLRGGRHDPPRGLARGRHAARGGREPLRSRSAEAPAHGRRPSERQEAAGRAVRPRGSRCRSRRPAIGFASS